MTLPAMVQSLTLCAGGHVDSADQDSVRLLAVESCGAFASALSQGDAAHHLLPVVQKFAQVRLLGGGKPAMRGWCP